MIGKWKKDKYTVKMKFGDAVNLDMTILMTVIEGLKVLMKNGYSYSGLVTMKDTWEELTDIPYDESVPEEDRQNIILNDVLKSFEELFELEMDRDYDSELVSEFLEYDKDSPERKAKHLELIACHEERSRLLSEKRHATFGKYARIQNILNI